MTKSIAISIPQRAEYGALEIKAYMRKATAKGFFSTLALISVLIAAYLLVPRIEIVIPKPPTHPQIVTVLDKVFTETAPTFTSTIVPPICQYSGFRAGAAYIPIPDGLFDDTKPEIATVGAQGISSAHGGEIPNSGTYDGTITAKQSETEQKIIITEEIEPKYDDPVIVDKEPEVDLTALSSNIVYPEIAKKVGLEGRVLIGVLVSKSGMVKRTKILSSDSPLFDKSAINAVENTTFTPAINAGKPVDCWVNIPINFKLK